MGKKVTIYLGKGGTHLASRSLVVTRVMRAGDDSAPAATYTNASIGATTETVTFDLPANQLWQAVAVDTNAAGDTSVPDVLNFHTGESLFPGPKSQDRLQILEMQDESSSSQSASSSSWSSTSASSESSSSSQSTSSSSESSQSTSASSQSSQSTSSSSESSSSSQSTSSSSESSSQSSRSASSGSSQSVSSTSTSSTSELSSSSWSS